MKRRKIAFYKPQLMINELQKIENSLFNQIPLKISNIIEDSEAKEYYGYDFQAGKWKLKFRKAKITPKKVGQFVTLWKRNLQNTTEPFQESDTFNFYIIAVEENEKYGFFLFPKNELIKRNILTTSSKTGKRGFRVYPSWTKTTNKQAEKTQSWQTIYFLDCTANDPKNTDKINTIINQ